MAETLLIVVADLGPEVEDRLSKPIGATDQEVRNAVEAVEAADPTLEG